MVEKGAVLHKRESRPNSPHQGKRKTSSIIYDKLLLNIDMYAVSHRWSGRDNPLPIG